MRRDLNLESDERRWTGCLALGPHWLLYAGAIGPTAEHRHHAVQVIAATNRVTVTIRAETVTAGLIVVPADVPHQIIDGTSKATVLFVDADALPTALPASPASPSEAIPDPDQVTYTDALRTADAMLSTIGAPPASRQKLSAEVEAAIQLLDRDLALPATRVANCVGLSSGELSRRFSREVGNPVPVVSPMETPPARCRGPRSRGEPHRCRSRSRVLRQRPPDEDVPGDVRDRPERADRYEPVAPRGIAHVRSSAAVLRGRTVRT